jgi:hypothetical protein
MDTPVFHFNGLREQLSGLALKLCSETGVLPGENFRLKIG